MDTVSELVAVLLSGSAVAEILVGSALKGSLVLVVCLLALFTWRRSPASIRHTILTFGLVCCLMFPVTAVVLISIGSPSLTGIHVFEIAPLTAGASMDLGEASAGFLGLPNWRSVVIAIWAAGVLLLLLRALVGLLYVNRLVKHASSVEDEVLSGLFRSCVAELGLTRPVRLLMHPAVRIPFTCGLFRPVIILDEEILVRPKMELRPILLHELAHIKRFDMAANLTAQVVFILFWFNPLVWIALRQLRHEQERACDDYVLASGEAATDYAELLLNFARQLGRRAAIVPAGIRFVRKASLGHRIESLFESGGHMRSVSKTTVAVLAVSAVAMVGVLSCVQTTTENAPTGDAGKADAVPAPDEFVEVDEMPVEVQRVEPVYPKALAEEGVSGIVWIQALVDQSGDVTDARVLKTSDHKEFDDAALEASWKNKYKPAMQDGKPVAVWVAYKVEFRWRE